MVSINFCGIHFCGLEQSQLFEEVADTRFVVTVNAEFIVKASHNLKFLNIINANCATFDGQIPYLFARLFNLRQHFSKISGSDLIYDACDYAQQHDKSLFLLGGSNRSNALAVNKIQQQVRLVVGCGGTFDFVSGQTKRAPRLVQKSGLEGLWRFLTEPRLFRLKRLLESTRFFSVLYNHHIALGRKHLL